MKTLEKEASRCAVGKVAVEDESKETGRQKSSKRVAEKYK